MGRPRKYNLNETYFETIDNENKAYIVGFIYADGSIDTSKKGSYYFRICLSIKDIEIINFIKKELQYNGPNKIIIIKDMEYVLLDICSKKIVSDLINIGVVKNKTYESEKLPTIPNEFIYHMIRGYFDGDGSIYSNKNKKGFLEYTVNFSSNMFILTEIKNLLSKVEISSSKIRYRNKTSIHSGMLDIRGSVNIEKIYHLMYDNSNFYLKRKYIRFCDFIKLTENMSKRKITKSVINEIKTLYLAGEKQSQIYKSLNVPFSSVRGIIQRLRKNNELG